MNSMKNLRKIGFKLNDEKMFPGQIPRRILKSECEVLRTSSMSLHEDLTERFGGGAWVLASYNVIWEIWTSFNQIYSAEKRKEKPPGGQVSGWTRRTSMQNFTVYLNGVDI